MDKIRTICPLMACPSYDGTVATVDGGRITGIEGDREHPRSHGFTCPKGRNEWRVLYHPQRITKPTLRTASGRREITWDEAIKVAAERLGEVINRFGPLSVCTTMPFPAMALFTRSLGSPNEMSNQDLCQGTAEVADSLTCGDVISIYRSSQDFRNSRCVLLAGTNMPHSCGGQWQDVLEAKKKGAKLIVIDPRRSEAAESADLYLQIRPGTDGALALAMMNVIVSENLYDAGFVRDFCLGFDELREHLKQCTPEWASQITWLSARQITDAARMYAGNRPASYRGNIGVCQHSNSTQTARAFCALVAITGNIDVQGGNRLSEWPAAGMNALVKAMRESRLSPEVEARALGTKEFPLWTGPQSVMHRPHNPTIIDAMLTGRPYPVKAWLINGANPVMTYAGSGKVIEAMRKLEFSMVLAYTPGATTELADLVLPIAHAFERNAIVYQSYGSWISPAPRLVPPPDGCREDIDILHDIAGEMVRRKYIEKNLVRWENYDEYVEVCAAEMGMTYAEFCRKGPLSTVPTYQKYAKRGFNTPSRKVELYSTRMEKHGYAPLPTYVECAESPETLPHLGEKYPLYLTTRRSRDYLLSRSAQYDWVRSNSPAPELQIHPEPARARGILEGDTVLIETPRGSVTHIARLTEGIHKDVVNGVYGWWLPEKGTIEDGCLGTNLNSVTSYDPPYDPEIGINRVQGVMCQVSKAG